MARYDGLASWYERYITTEVPWFTDASGRLVSDLLGPGPGRCLDIGCGGGIYLPLLVDLGWGVVGVDVSDD
jgi:2-polyprenyl-3-methyl-5-hydroxy-6-metoxy-1,4-benzoquinol methylase